MTIKGLAFFIAGLLLLAVACSASPAPTETTPPPPTPILVGPPLDIVIVEINQESRTPDVYYTIENVSDKVIDAYEVVICPTNIFGESLKRSGIGDECVKVSGDTVLHTPGEDPPKGYDQWAFDGVWAWTSPIETKFWQKIAYPNYPLSGYETATEATIRLYRAHFEDGSVWELGELIPPP